MNSKVASLWAVAFGWCILSDAGAVAVQGMDSGLSAEDLANDLVIDRGMQISNVRVTGNAASLGLFSAGGDAIGLDSGVILSSGYVADAAGPNTSSWTGEDSGSGGDADLDLFFPDGAGSTVNVAALEFDFVTQGDLLELDLVFGSEDYLESVDSFIQEMGWYDAFGVFLDGEALSLVPGEAAGAPMTIFEINDLINPALFRDNDAAVYDVEYDGLTTVLGVQAPVSPGQTHSLKLTIADGGDPYIDSAAFVSNLTTNAPLARAPTPIQIPTLGAWSLGLLGLLMMALAAPLARRDGSA